jgi:Leucine-rich repeat (LRR) protein
MNYINKQIEYYFTEKLDLSNQKLTKLPEDIYFYRNLTVLYCNNNKLTYLPELPSSLKELNCSNNQLTYLPEFPSSLQIINCSNNQLYSIPEYPYDIKIINCSNNKLVCLPDLVDRIHILLCNNNLLTKLPWSYNNITKFGSINCDNNPFTENLNYKIGKNNLKRYFMDDYNVNGINLLEI